MACAIQKQSYFVYVSWFGWLTQTVKVHPCAVSQLYTHRINGSRLVHFLVLMCPIHPTH